MEEKKMEGKNVNMNIQDGDSFFAHELSINFNPLQFILDFKCITPRVDPRGQDGSIMLSMKHNVVMLDVFHAKRMHELLGKVIGDYEKQFGAIEKPKALQKYENISRKEESKAKPKKGKEARKKERLSPNYFG